MQPARTLLLTLILVAAPVRKGRALLRSAKRGPTLAIALIMMSALVAGCVDNAKEPVDPAATGTLPTVEAPEAVDRFLGNGTPLPVEDVPGTASYLLTGHDGAEPNIGITDDGSIFVTSGEAVIKSTDDGATWEEVWRVVGEDDGVVLDDGAYQSFDPMLWVDPVTDRVFADPMYPPLLCSHLAWSDDGGESWTERPGVCHPPPMDHQKLASGVPGPEAPPVAGEAYPTVLYQCYNQVTSTICAVSYDGGLNWVTHQVAADDARHDCAGTNGHPNVGPDGVVAVPISSGCSQPTVAISHDSGTTWEFVQAPVDHPVTGIDPEVNFGPDGTLYLMYRSDDHVTYLLRSPDYGASWEGPFRVTPPQVQSTVFYALATGTDGRVAMGFLGTEDTDRGPDDAPDEARWHLYIVTSENARNGTPAFTSYQVTPDDDPVQIGRICMGGVGCDDGSRNLLDFIDGEIAPDGTFHVVYTEGCVDACAADPNATPEDSRSRVVALGTVDGWRLVDEPGNLPVAVDS